VEVYPFIDHQQVISSDQVLSAHDVVAHQGLEIVSIEARLVALRIVGFSLLWGKKVNKFGQ